MFTKGCPKWAFQEGHDIQGLSSFFSKPLSMICALLLIQCKDQVGIGRQKLCSFWTASKRSSKTPVRAQLASPFLAPSRYPASAKQDRMTPCFSSLAVKNTYSEM